MVNISTADQVVAAALSRLKRAKGERKDAMGS